MKTYAYPKPYKMLLLYYLLYFSMAIYFIIKHGMTNPTGLLAVSIVIVGKAIIVSLLIIVLFRVKIIRPYHIDTDGKYIKHSFYKINPDDITDAKISNWIFVKYIKLKISHKKTRYLMLDLFNQEEILLAIKEIVDQNHPLAKVVDQVMA